MKCNQMQPVANETLQDKAYDLLGEMILEQEANEVLAELQRERRSGQASEMDTFFEKRDRMYLKKIEQAYNKSLWRKWNEKLFSKATQVAALIILGVFTLGAVTVAASADVRIQLMQLFSRMTAEYTTLELIPVSEHLSVPEGWKGSYYMGYIPDGLSLAQCLPNEVIYWNNGDIAVSVNFFEGTATSSTNIDTEDARISSVTVQGVPAQMSEKGRRVMIWWAIKDRYFIVTTKGYDVNTALQVAENIKKIK